MGPLRAPYAAHVLWARQRVGCGRVPTAPALRRTVSSEAAGAATAGAKHVVVGLSGGVDSSVAALLLLRAGHHVTGVYMCNWDSADEDDRSCRADPDWDRVQRLSEQLRIACRRVSFAPAYWTRVFCDLVDGYTQGRTPNPDVLCNRDVKFAVFRDHALRQLRADFVATGHYARLECDPATGRPRLLRAVDSTKDQSYFLAAVRPESLERVLFPVGHLRKCDVRSVARDAGLCTADAPESAGLCFVGKRRFARFIRNYVAGPTALPGPCVVLDGAWRGPRRRCATDARE